VSAFDGSSKNLKDLKDANAWWAANENADEYGGGARPNVVASKTAEISAIHTWTDAEVLKPRHCSRVAAF